MCTPASISLVVSLAWKPCLTSFHCSALPRACLVAWAWALHWPFGPQSQSMGEKIPACRIALRSRRRGPLLIHIYMQIWLGRWARFELGHPDNSCLLSVPDHRGTTLNTAGTAQFVPRHACGVLMVQISGRALHRVRSMPAAEPQCFERACTCGKFIPLHLCTGDGICVYDKLCQDHLTQTHALTHSRTHTLLR